VQQSVAVEQVAPMIAQLEGPFSHRRGFPAQLPVQHSSLVVQDAPAAMQAEVQTAAPAALAVQEPLQQVSPEAHGAPRGRQGPGPKSQRPLAGSQSPQQSGMELFEQLSPVERQSAGASVHTPSAPGHSFEQQSPSTLQGVPSIAQSAAPHVPALHPSEQQSVAALQGAPSTTQ
jgi:hypothetical protein